ncbi:restriction endonuclease subunit S [Corynebacterium urealyticum]|uniref:restriction endonuclease subunit S n=1 Tax=Corynebacterium urealyticum TaxID=43771 RepID=UPI000347BB66|nr:restriction endonuclease subunit S [Corynebacterium urealyticum]QQB07366.1 restriction endonuclease subunit S [Corynebacterium urealyticum]TYT20765.1 restriction endonuclease subunit S [Corynebacterium urealyticum]
MPIGEAFEINPKVSIKRGTDVPFISMDRLEPGRRDVDAVETRSYSSGSKFEPGDTLMARITPCLENGKIARYLPKDEPMPAAGSTEFMVLRGRPGITKTEFAYYFAIDPTIHDLAVTLMTGTSGRQRVDVRAFSETQVRIPNLENQRAISSVLGSLDDKIAANNDVVSASNELIRNLYRALPESSRTLNEVASLAKNNEQPHRFLPDKRLVGLEHFDPKSLWLPRSSEPETATSAKTKFQAGDTLFGKLRPYFHKVAIAPFDGYCSTDILVLRAENPLHSPLVAAAANSDAVVQQAVNSSNGTRMPRAKWTDIEGCPIPDPDAPATLEFIDFAATLIQDATARLEENKALAKTRDELLPLLMSGKITVREVSQEAAAAGAQIPSEENEV